jgi:hypothetical protein
MICRTYPGKVEQKKNLNHDATIKQLTKERDDAREESRNKDASITAGNQAQSTQQQLNQRILDLENQLRNSTAADNGEEERIRLKLNQKVLELEGKLRDAEEREGLLRQGFSVSTCVLRGNCTHKTVNYKGAAGSGFTSTAEYQRIQLRLTELEEARAKQTKKQPKKRYAAPRGGQEADDEDESSEGEGQGEEIRSEGKKMKRSLGGKPGAYDDIYKPESPMAHLYPHEVKEAQVREMTYI